MITTCPPRVIRSDDGGFRVYRGYAQDGQWSTLRYEVPPGVAMCRICGCTFAFGCSPPCAWVDSRGRLCSRCWERLVR